MKNDIQLKSELYQQCLEYLNSRQEVIEKTIEDLQESLFSETKSSAGDKHETNRAMIQLEREKAGNQLLEIQKTNQLLSKIDINKSNKMVSLGSLVYTSSSNYFIAISAGELRIDHEIFYAISPSTPIGKLLIGKNEGDKITFREESFVITKTL